uniref:Piezo non-specific cation channel R-Ras-binding domain-containing protein n=1 Tax=Setaria digitata TaxID=48799 RepID=A0A915PQ08_9BILA
MDRSELLGLRLTGLTLLAFTSISYPSYFHLILFTISLGLNTVFAFRRTFTLSAGVPYFFCPANVEDGCEEHSWNVYAGVITELCLASLLFWARRLSFSSMDYMAEAKSISLHQIYLLTPVSVIFWALFFPSWLNFLWILVSWFLFSLIGERRHRLSAAPIVLTFASVLLLFQYISGLTNFQGTMLEKLGLHSGVGSAAFYPLLIKLSLCLPFYMMRYFDGKQLETFDTFKNIDTTKIPDVSLTSVRRISIRRVSLESILYICLYYMYTLIHGDWLSLPNDQWLSPVVRTLASALWLPFCFIFLLIFVHIKRFGTSNNIMWKPTSVFACTIAASYDTLIAISLCCFAGYNLSITGIVLLMLSLIIFISTGQKCTATCSAATLLLSLQWLVSFVTYAFHLPNYTYPINCTTSSGMVLDSNTAKWLGFSPNQTWPVVILLLIISMRSAFSTERSEWLIEVQRSDAEKNAASLLKFLLKNWMYKFGVEFFHCRNYFWNEWNTEVKKFFVIPHTTSSYPTFIADYILLLLILVQKDSFDKEDAFCKFGFTFPCWLERVLGLHCNLNECLGHYKTTGLICDMICFVVLTYQMRVFNSWYFQFVIMDYRADRILGSRGAELFLELREREAQKHHLRLQSNVKWLQMMVEEEDKQAPISVGPPPQSHEEIKRSGYYHQVSERFFPLLRADANFEREQTCCSISCESEENVLENIDNATMVDKTVEVLDSVRVTVMHIFQLLNNPEWLFKISKGDAYVAHVLDNDKKRIKTILKDRLRIADTVGKLHELRKELIHRTDFQSVASSEVLWNEAINEYRAIHPAFKFLYCFSHSIMAQSELICFILMLVVHLSKSSLITFPLPLMVFFWGALAIPRPPKCFWLITASYIQFIIIFRLILCNELIMTLVDEQSISDNNPFSIRKLLAMDPNIDGAYWDVALLAMVFFHQYKLLRLGMWRNDFQVREQHLTLQEAVEDEDTEKMSDKATSCETFCEALLMKKTQSSIDWYPWMVGCDALCLILISFFYSMMGQGGSGNLLLDVQVGRTLVSEFELNPPFPLVCVHLEGRMVTWNGVSISLYIIKSAYLLMSAWHMRNGYPSVMNRDLLTGGSGIFRLIILKIYLNIPFLFELRTAMDWTFTSTALSMGDFIRMENYYNEVEAQHCWILFDHWLDNYFPTRRGRPTPTSGKFFKGVLSITVLIIIILAPILLFAFLNSYGTRAPPKRLHVVASIEGYPELYSTDSVFNDESISHLSEHSMQALINELANLEESDVKRSALSFISDYSFKDIFLINLTLNSLRNWDISLPGKKQLIKELETSKTTRMLFEMSLLRPVGSTQRSHNFIVSTVLTSAQTKIFLDLISGNITTARMSFPFAQFLLAPPNGYLQPADAINLALKRIHCMSTWQYHGDYWSVSWDRKLVIFVDRIVPSWMNIIVGSGGMVAMYVAVILVVGRFVREIVRTRIHNAMIENIPNCENLLRLFHDIYVVREKRQFYLESRLYGKLVFLMRSPETLIRWCRYRVKVKNE